MKIERIGYKGRAVVILGAGATRGAEFVQRSNGSLPPLDSDFFTQAQRLSSAKPESLLATLIKDVVSVCGRNFSVTMEGYLTKLEQLSHILDDYKLGGRPPQNRYVQMRSRFLQVLAALLDESIGRHPECGYHARLVGSMSAGDTILSMNYDWLIDHTLKKHAKGKWNPREGYGVRVYTKGRKGAGTRYWACQNGSGQQTYSRRTIRLLKLHGSMNWFPVAPRPKKPRLELRTRWWHQHGKLKFEVAPPEWNKPTRSGVYVPIWRAARRALRSAEALVVIGYSLPESDLPVHALLNVEENPQPLELLIVVNPDQVARQRIRSALQKRISDSTRVMSFDCLSRFDRFLSANDSWG